MEHAFLPLPPGSDGRLRRVQRETKPSSSTDYPWSSSQDSQRKTLNRKLEIQRRRNQVWRSQWSKVTTTKSESTLESNIIDESLSRAGLADVAKGVMETIDDILTELDRMNGAEDQSSGGSWDILGETKLPIANWDGERFKDLVVDLTSSVDTLYDISETRQRVKTSKVSNKFELNVEPEKAFEKARMDTPIFIDPSRILNYLSLESVVSRKSDGTKTLVFPASKDTFCLEPISGKSDASISPSDQPVFVEFAEYDDVYSATGIGPSMTRFEKLFSALQRQKTSAKAPKFGILNLLGYFEDVERSRYGLVYELPKKKEKEATTSMLQPRSESNYFHCRLAELMGHRQAEPPLEMKFRLAYRLATSVFDLHSRGVVHGRLAAANVLFFQASFREQDDQWQRSINIRRPYLTSFDLFPEPASNGDSNKEPLEVRWYRHKSDPRLDQNSRYTTESKELDLYSLSLLLMEIGLWQSLRESEFAISRNSMVLNVKGGNIDHVYEKLSTRCGSAYRKAIQACWEATEEKSAEGSQTNTRSDIHLQKLYGQVLRLLQRCCSIDEKWTDMDYDDVSPVSNELLKWMNEG